jgi:hypothetical protein
MPTKNENNQALHIPTLAANTGAKTELFSATWVVIAVGKETLVAGDRTGAPAPIVASTQEVFPGLTRICS